MNGFNLHRAYAIARKEVMHVLRDPITLTLALGLPGVALLFTLLNAAMLTVRIGCENRALARAGRASPRPIQPMKQAR